MFVRKSRKRSILGPVLEEFLSPYLNSSDAPEEGNLLLIFGPDHSYEQAYVDDIYDVRHRVRMVNYILKRKGYITLNEVREIFDLDYALGGDETGWMKDINDPLFYYQHNKKGVVIVCTADAQVLL